MVDHALLGMLCNCKQSFVMRHILDGDERGEWLIPLHPLPDSCVICWHCTEVKVPRYAAHAYFQPCDKDENPKRVPVTRLEDWEVVPYAWLAPAALKGPFPRAKWRTWAFAR